MMNKLHLIVFLFLSISMLSCENDFYSYRRSGDLWRLPLIEPLELISPTKESFVLKLDGFNPFSYETKRPYQITAISEIAIYNYFIFVRSTKSRLPNGSRPAWFKIYVKSDGTTDVEVFDKLEDFNKDLLDENLAGKIKFHPIEALVKNFLYDLSLPPEW